MTGADIARRAWTAYRQGIEYRLGAKTAPSIAPGPGVAFDCTGFQWWAAGRRQVAKLDSDKFGPRLLRPELGAMVWHDAAPGKAFGHGGVIVKVWPDGDYDSLDCSSTDPAARGGAVRYLQRARSFWARTGNAPVFRRSAGVAGAPGVATGAILAVLAAAAVAWRMSDRRV